MVSTQDDRAAPVERRLALKLAREVFGARSSAPATLERYEALFGAALAQGRTLEQCRRFVAWLGSGSGYWRGKQYMFRDTAFAAEWQAWEGQGEPDAKPVYQPAGALAGSGSAGSGSAESAAGRSMPDPVRKEKRWDHDCPACQGLGLVSVQTGPYTSVARDCACVSYEFVLPPGVTAAPVGTSSAAGRWVS